MSATHKINADVEVIGTLSITGDGSNATVMTESSSGEFKIDTVADITLDFGGGDLILSDGGTIYGTISQSSSTYYLYREASSAPRYSKVILRGPSITFSNGDKIRGCQALTTNSVTS